MHTRKNKKEKNKKKYLPAKTGFKLSMAMDSESRSKLRSLRRKLVADGV